MSRFTLLMIAIALIASCKEEKKPDQPQKKVTAGNIMVDSVAIVNSTESNLNVQTNSFAEIDSSGILMFPLSMSESKRSGGSLTYKELPANTYWNVIFFNTKTGEQHMLTDKKILITNFDYRYSNSDLIDISQTSTEIFYRVVVNDYNNDRVLGSDDPDYLFASDKLGNNFRQISPDNCNLISWQYIRSSDKIVMIVTKDSDNNKEFGEKDEVAAFQITPAKDSVATEIFSPEFKNTLKVMFGKDWKRLKN
jgi:hypothetical protein